MPIYHITQLAEWEKTITLGQYSTPSLLTEGFIHASTLEQVISTANMLFHGQSGLVLLVIDTKRLKPELRYELAPGTDQKFPHIYGALNLDAVEQVVAFPPGAQGAFNLPPEI
jgi:uncharacterized protein (DUF952 family)